MQPYLIDLYAGILESEQAVTFEHNDTIYRIWWSDGSEGWYMELLTESDAGMWNEDLTRIIDESPWLEVDGGLCTGSARDAVEFMTGDPLPVIKMTKKVY